MLVAKRTPTDRRYYTYGQYLEYKGFDNENNNSKKIILYTRVSTNNQKDDLKNPILSGTVSKKAGKYFVSVLIEVDDRINEKQYSCGIGCDFGIKDTLITSNGMKFKNINKTSKVKRLERKLKKEQRKLSRKYESLKIRSKNEKGGATR